MQRLMTQRVSISVFIAVALTMSATAQAADKPIFHVCETSPWEPAATEAFAKSYNQALSRKTPHPGAQDVLAVPGGNVTSEAWFSYGMFDVGLVGEKVAVERDVCSGWNTLGTTTSRNDGKAVLQFNAGPDVGRYRLTSEVLGDNTAVSAHLHVLPAGTHVVVFDIDGTLTTDNFQLYMQIVDPSYVPQAFPDAAAATQAFADKGYVIVYLTGRPFSFSAITRAWLNGQGMAPGHLHFVERAGDMATTNAGVGEYKKHYIQSLQAAGLVVDYAYGNEPTDVYAYEGAGLDPNAIFMLGPKAGYGHTQPLPQGYGANLQFINDLPAPAQPFVMP